MRLLLSSSQCVPSKNQVIVCCPVRTGQRSLLPDVGLCGFNDLDKIVGGVNTSITEFPWMALLEYVNPCKYFCLIGLCVFDIRFNYESRIYTFKIEVLNICCIYFLNYFIPILVNKHLTRFGKHINSIEEICYCLFLSSNNQKEAEIDFLNADLIILSYPTMLVKSRQVLIVRYLVEF